MRSADPKYAQPIATDDYWEEGHIFKEPQQAWADARVELLGLCTQPIDDTTLYNKLECWLIVHINVMKQNNDLYLGLNWALSNSIGK